MSRQNQAEADYKHGRILRECLLCRLAGKTHTRLPQVITQWKVLEGRLIRTKACSLHSQTRDDILVLIRSLRVNQEIITQTLMGLRPAVQTIAQQSEDIPLPYGS